MTLEDRNRSGLESCVISPYFCCKAEIRHVDSSCLAWRYERLQIVFAGRPCYGHRKGCTKLDKTTSCGSKGDLLRPCLPVKCLKNKTNVYIFAELYNLKPNIFLQLRRRLMWWLGFPVKTMQTFIARLSKSETDWEIMAFLKPVKKKNDIG